MNPIKQMLTEGNGTWSLLRVCVLVIIAELLFEHVYSLVQEGKPMPWNYQDVLALVGALGAKVAQKPMEARGPQTTTPASNQPGVVDASTFKRLLVIILIISSASLLTSGPCRFL